MTFLNGLLNPTIVNSDLLMAFLKAMVAVDIFCVVKTHFFAIGVGGALIFR